MPHKTASNAEFHLTDNWDYTAQKQYNARTEPDIASTVKRLKPFPILLLMVLSLLALPLWGVEFSKEMKALESMFWEGDLEELPAKLLRSKPKGDEELALQSYLNAMLQTSQKDTRTLLTQTMQRYPSTLYGQKSMIEMAKLLIFERKYADAEKQLNEINNFELVERHYWLAYCSQALDRHEEAVNRAKEYLRRQPGGKYVEDTYYLIATARQNQRKYADGIQALEDLRAIHGLPRSKQYYHYLLGRLHHLGGNWSKAYENYKQGFLLNEDSQLAYELEDLLFELKDARGSSIDLSFLYPYTALDIPDLPLEPPPPPQMPALDLSKEPFRAETRPSGSNYIQAGRFSTEANARARTSEMRALNLNAYYFEDKANKSIPWVVFCGPYLNSSETEAVRQILIKNSIDSFTTRY